MEMLRPPLLRAMNTLDRSLFERTIPLAAAKVRDRNQIQKIRLELQSDLFKLERLQSIHAVTDQSGKVGKAVLLQPKIRPNSVLNRTSDYCHTDATHRTIYVEPEGFRL